MKVFFQCLLTLLVAIVVGSFSLGLHRPKILRTARFLNSEVRLNPVIVNGTRQLETWFDECIVFVKGGTGGDGSNEFHYRNKQRVRPCGGNGGHGGSVIFVTETNINTLKKFKYQTSFLADRGIAGNKSFANGANARDLIVKLPVGSIIRNNDTDEVIAELTDANQRLVIAKGGQGGVGNAGSNMKGGVITCKAPKGGEKMYVKIELKMVADIGLLGVPNAGKSTLLSVMTRARPKIAPYAFTTLVPNLGVCYDDTGDEEVSMIMADIPGLVEGASKGKGLGKAFLRHIERCKILIHLINGQSPHPIEDFLAINQELKMFSPVLAMKPQIVVLNKIDLPLVQKRKDEILEHLQSHMSHNRLMAISANDRLGVEDLIVKTSRFLQKLKSSDAK